MLLKIIGIILILAILFVIVESMLECGRFKTKKYILEDVKGEKFTGFKIAMFADLHNCRYGKNCESIIKALEEYAPDVIILAGDMVVCREKHRKNNLDTARILNDLCHIAPVYYGIGNHEGGLMEGIRNTQGNWDEYLSVLDDRISILDNSHSKMMKDRITFCIFGLHINKDGYGRFKTKSPSCEDIKDMIGTPDSGDYNILIAHNPDYFKNYSEWGADLVLSGHNHGGLVKLPLLGGVLSPRLHLFPKYSYGLYKNRESKMVLTGGLGSHSLKIRVNNVPELVFVELKSKNK